MPAPAAGVVATTVVTLITAPPPRAIMPGTRLLHEHVRRPQVGVELIIEVVIGGVERRRETVDACIVDQNVDGTRLVGQATHVVPLGDVGGDETCFAAAVFDVLHRLRAPFGVAAVHDDLGAFGSELDGDA